jgi:hypothetical protein
MGLTDQASQDLTTYMHWLFYTWLVVVLTAAILAVTLVAMTDRQYRVAAIRAIPDVLAALLPRRRCARPRYHGRFRPLGHRRRPYR